MESEHNDELDRILDRGLPGYSEAEPLAGLEQRVLNRIEGARQRRRRLSWWGLALSGAAALLIGGVLLETSSSPVPPRRAAVVAPPAHSFEVVPSRVQSAAAHPHRPMIRTRALPKQPVFPMPAPLTREERALLAFVEQSPAQALQAFADSPRREIQPIVIEPIQIPLLEHPTVDVRDGRQ